MSNKQNNKPYNLTNVITFDHIFSRIFYSIVNFSGWLLFIACPVIVLGQVIEWLQHGTWLPHSALSAFVKIFQPDDAIFNNWIGVWKILDLLPVSILLLCIGYLLLFLSDSGRRTLPPSIKRIETEW